MVDPSVQQKAAEFIQRKAAGQRISFAQAEAEGFNVDVLRAEFQKQLSVPEARRAVSRGARRLEEGEGFITEIDPSGARTITKKDVATFGVKRRQTSITDLPPNKQKGFEQKQLGEIQPIEQRGGFAASEQRAFKELSRLRTKEQRGELKGLERVGLAGATFSTGLVESVKGFGALGLGLITRPVETIKQIPSGFKTSVKETGQLLKTGSPEEIVSVGLVQATLFKGVGAGAKGIGSVASKGRALASPRFKTIQKVEGRQFIKDVVTPTGRTIDIELGGGVKQLAEPLPRQVSLIGKEVDVVTAQRGLFRTLGGKELTVQKPLPSPKAPPLEQALFGDPRARLRPSRLGLEARPEASIFDILSGDVAFTRPQPQAILFEQQTIQKLPKRLSKIEIKLRTEKTLTQAEQRALTEFQLEPSGQFKPIGFLSKEPEVTLAPGEIIRRQKTIGVTLIQGRRVPIISAEVTQPTSRTARLLKKRQAGKITQAERKILNKRLKEETGFDISRQLETRPFVSPSRAALSIGVPSISAISSFLPTGRQADSLGFSPEGISPEGLSPKDFPSLFGPPSKGAPSPIRIVGGISPFAPSPIAEFGLFEPIEGPPKPRIELDRRKKKKKVEKKRKRPPARIAPSLTGIGLEQLGDITGVLPTGKGEFGVTPFETRFVQRRRKKKTKKKVSKKKKGGKK